MLKGQALLPDGVDEDEHGSGVQRVVQGVPVEEVVGAYRAVMGVLRDAFLELAADTEVPAYTVLDGTRRLWELTDHYSSELVAARHEIDLDIARRQERQRLGFLQRVLTGNLFDAEIKQGGAAYGLTANARYWVVRARDVDGHQHELGRQIEKVAAGSRLAPLLGPIDGDVAGLTVQKPRVDETAGTIAVVGPVPLSQVSQAFAEVTRLLNVAVRYKRRGLVDPEMMSIRLAVVQEHEIGQILCERYVRPVLETEAIGEVILGSVQTFLAYQRRIQAAAKALSVHQNTLRYRLAKFEEVTRASLVETETIIEVWWSLEYWDFQRNDPHADPPPATPQGQ
jgi:putative transposase